MCAIRKCWPIFDTIVSGCLIIQNGKILGADTHVFVNDSTKGYGIFIENMLKEARRYKGNVAFHNLSYIDGYGTFFCFKGKHSILS